MVGLISKDYRTNGKWPKRKKKLFVLGRSTAKQAAAQLKCKSRLLWRGPRETIAFSVYIVRSHAQSLEAMIGRQENNSECLEETPLTRP